MAVTGEVAQHCSGYDLGVLAIVTWRTQVEQKGQLISCLTDVLSGSDPTVPKPSASCIVSATCTILQDVDPPAPAAIAVAS